MIKRRCKKCRKLLPATERYFQRIKGYLQHTCLPCRRDYIRKWKKANPELARKWRDANREYFR